MPNGGDTTSVKDYKNELTEKLYTNGGRAHYVQGEFDLLRSD